jgi:TRAP-type C4-dicarboxylate transport system permease large subunit
MSKIIIASLPFIVVLLFVLAIITYVPWLSLALLK